jgi:hypothetical protein
MQVLRQVAATAHAAATPGFSDPVTVATLMLAALTAGLVVVTYLQGRLARRELELSIRPLLVNPGHELADEGLDRILFGAPGRISVEVPRGELFYRGSGSKNFYLSVAFENIGAGAAAIIDARTEPSFPGQVYVSRTFVPVGSLVRVNVSVLVGEPGTERFENEWWAMDGPVVIVRYSDTNGGQVMVSRATIKQYATMGPHIEELTVCSGNGQRVIAHGRGSY